VVCQYLCDCELSYTPHQVQKEVFFKIPFIGETIPSLPLFASLFTRKEYLAVSNAYVGLSRRLVVIISRMVRSVLRIQEKKRVGLSRRKELDCLA
jgi:hypothetical protein